MAVALALVGVGAGGLAAAAWIGLVPGVQLRQRTTPADEMAALPSAPARVPAADDRQPEVDVLADPTPDAAHLASATEEADASTASISAAEVAAGDALYRGAGRCAGCHGSAGEGVAGLGPSLDDGAWLHGSGRGAIQRVTAEGVSPPLGGYAVAMPAYGAQLGPEQLRQLATYVWALSHPDALRADSTAPRPSVPAQAPAAPSVPALRPTVPAP